MTTSVSTFLFVQITQYKDEWAVPNLNTQSKILAPILISVELKSYFHSYLFLFGNPNLSTQISNCGQCGYGIISGKCIKGSTHLGDKQDFIAYIGS